MEEIGKIVVIGSVNIDYYLETNCFPEIGETMVSKKFFKSLGGKGINQAVSSRMLGSDVKFIGAIGDDHNNDYAKELMVKNKISTDDLLQCKGTPTGMAFINISCCDNKIILNPGANYCLSREYIDSKRCIISNADIVVLQLEIPLDLVEYVLELCHENGVVSILNPAPYKKLTNKILDLSTYAIVNEIEYKQLLNDVDGIENCEKIIRTLGSKGVSFVETGHAIEIKSVEVDVKDTTGAGDTFVGAFASALGRGMDLQSSIKFANCAAAISVGKYGAQNLITYKEVEELVKKTYK